MGLNVEHLSVSLTGKSIIRDISLKVQDKQFVGLLGPNGCGKSTLLRCVYKAIKPESGNAYLDDLNIFHSGGKLLARQLSVVSQFNELNFDFSVLELVMMGRTPHKKFLENENTEDFAIAEKAIAAVGLEEFVDRSFMTLSGGEKQRVILARAITQSPSFMILDEPTNHLDIKYQLQILSTVQSLNIGVLAAMHDLSLAAIYCAYIYLLKNGKIVAAGTPAEVLTQENIKNTYEVDCRVYPNPIDGRLTITYVI